MLIYPFDSSRMSTPFEQFQRVTNDDKEIIGMRVSPELVGLKRLAHFAGALAEYVRPLMLAAQQE